MLKIGDRAPLDIEVIDALDKTVSLNDYFGKLVVIYFYPKDNTPGCTKEACGIRDWLPELKNLGVHVIAVSKDSPEAHRRFIKKYNLNFVLWSDAEHKLMEAFGTWQKKKFMGREYMGTTRSTFALDKNGKIIHVWENVTPNSHGEEIYQFFRKA